MRACLAIAVLLLMASPSLAQTRIESMEFLPGSSTILVGNDGLVVVNFIYKGVTKRGLLCDNKNDIDAEALCNAMGFTLKGLQYIYKKSLASLSNVPTERISTLSCVADRDSSGYLGSCSFVSPATCPDNQLVPLYCHIKRPASTTAPATLPTLAPVNCSVGASPNVRLMNTSNHAVTTTGRLEFYMNATKKWEAVCNYDFNSKEAAIICNMLCSSGATPKAVSGPTGGTIVPGVVMSCQAGATDISGCTMNPATSKKAFCTEKDVAHVFCTDPNTGATAPAQVGQLVCKDSLATMTFAKSENPGMSDTSIVLPSVAAHPGCTYNVSDNGTHILVEYTFTLCADSKEYTLNETFYKTTFLRVYKAENGIITQTNATFSAKCGLKKDVDINGGDIGGQTRTEKPLTGTDQPTVSLQLFSDKEMTKELKKGQVIEISSKTRVYARLTETSNVPETHLAVRMCWLTPSANRNDAVRKYLIVDGCKNPALVGNLVLNTNLQVYFDFKPVLFSQTKKTFYLHCNTKTCSKTDSGTDCRRTCTNNNPKFDRRRRKRSVDPNEEKFDRRRRKRSVDLNEFLRSWARGILQAGQRGVDAGPYYLKVPILGSNALVVSVPLLLGSMLLAALF